MSDQNDDMIEGSEEFEREKAEERKRLGVVFGCGLAVFALIWIGTGCARKPVQYDLVPVVDYREPSPKILRYVKIPRPGHDGAVVAPKGYDFARYEVGIYPETRGRWVEVGYGLKDDGKDF